MMRNALLVSLLLPAAACTETTTSTTTDNPITVAVKGDSVVVAAAEATESTGFGCGGGTAFLGRSVLFVSGDRGETFERIVPEDQRPLMRIVSRDGVFYAVAHSNDGAFGVVTSVDGANWTEVASAQRYAQDLAAADDLLVVAHATGVMTSPDGSAWTDHDLGEGYYQASVARTGGTLAIGTNVDNKLHLSSDAVTWRTQSLAGFNGIDQVVAVGDKVLVTGYTQGGSGMALVDLANPTAATVRTNNFVPRGFVTPAGFLDTSGGLTPIENNTIGATRPHVDYFTAAAVDGQTVVVTRENSISTSIDGGATFGATYALPIVIIETEVESTENELGGPRG